MNSPDSTLSVIDPIQPVSTELVICGTQNGLTLSRSQAIAEKFQALFDSAAEWAARVNSLSVTDISQVREMKLAREYRLALKELRIQAERARKGLKDAVLLEGRAIDGCYNLIEFVIKPIEKQLLDQEQFAERKEAARIAGVKLAREELLKAYGINTNFVDLAAMTDEAFVEFHANTRLGFEARQEAARVAEQARVAKEIADNAERERVRLEIVAAQKAAEERAAQDRAEAIKARAALAVVKRNAEAAAAAAVEKARVEREAAEKLAAAEVAERNRIQDLLDAELSRKKAKEDEAAKAAAAEKAESDLVKANIKAAEAAAAAAPDRDKLAQVADDLNDFIIPKMATERGQAIARQIDATLNELVAEIGRQSATL